MFDVIVVGTDGSETAAVALGKAIELANHAGAVLHVVHAHRLVSTAQLGQAASIGAPTFDIGQVNQGIQEESRLVCERAADRAKAAGVKVETHEVPGDASDALLDVAEQVGADLLVVGNRGLAGIKGRLLGSVPADATRRSECDVLVVHTTG